MQVLEYVYISGPTEYLPALQRTITECGLHTTDCPLAEGEPGASLICSQSVATHDYDLEHRATTTTLRFELTQAGTPMCPPQEMEFLCGHSPLNLPKQPTTVQVADWLRRNSAIHNALWFAAGRYEEPAGYRFRDGVCTTFHPLYDGLCRAYLPERGSVLPDMILRALPPQDRTAERYRPWLMQLLLRGSGGGVSLTVCALAEGTVTWEEVCDAAVRWAQTDEPYLPRRLLRMAREAAAAKRESIAELFWVEQMEAAAPRMDFLYDLRHLRLPPLPRRMARVEIPHYAPATGPRAAELDAARARSRAVHVSMMHSGNKIQFQDLRLHHLRKPEGREFYASQLRRLEAAPPEDWVLPEI